MKSNEEMAFLTEEYANSLALSMKLSNFHPCFLFMNLSECWIPMLFAFCSMVNLRILSLSGQSQDKFQAMWDRGTQPLMVKDALKDLILCSCEHHFHGGSY
ncbi:hypothetical protein PVK06_021392 [Gossypium arboreum]|uniref:Uncharacterized protein n=1 Tax=Gossypium arboreum TaxID=29729 RepID=A0ABR0PQL4_GOSAR|nr:hypothetical protein PVK06_021392 [Gossypium arboreum]